MKITILLLLLSTCLISFVPAAETPCKKANTPTQSGAKDTAAAEESLKNIEEILAKMQAATQQLKSCKAKVAYLFTQDPELLDSKTLRNGMLFYQKHKDHSALRIRFDDIKQEDFEVEKYRQEYLFDGVWLTRLDFKLKQADRYQKAPEDKPIDVFDLISHNFPLVGFSNIEHLKKDFDIRDLETVDKKVAAEGAVRLILHVKKGSKYEKEYKKIDFWVSTKNFMPLRIAAYSSQGDIHDIQFKELEMNNKLEKGVFSVETPTDFIKNEEPLIDIRHEKTKSKPRQPDK